MLFKGWRAVVQVRLEAVSQSLNAMQELAKAVIAHASF
jgi:hypothetical protein